MMIIPNKPLTKRPVLTRGILFAVICFIFQSCIGYYVIPERLELERKYDYPVLDNINALYLESFTGRDAARLLPIFTDEIKKRGIHTILTELPKSDREQVGVLRIQVEDVIYVEDKIEQISDAEKEEQLEQDETIIIDITKLPEAIRKNAAVSISFSIRRLSDNLLLYEKTIGRSFQQVYNDPIRIGERADADFETDRLARLIFSSFAEKIDTKTKTVSVALEKGVSYPYEYRQGGLSGNAVIIKGIRYADGQIWDLAVLTWLVAAYEPDKYYDEETYLINRASAFFNIGQVYRLNKEWGKAAEMFAEANLTYPRLHYAQFWSDMIIMRKLSESNTEENSEQSLNETQKKIEVPLEKTISEKESEQYALQPQDVQVNIRKINRKLILREESLYSQISEI